ncbi:hypothetical protein AWW66_31240 [Micromonospora rosaria]|uniref:Nbr1 FW domain-containing protein n=1 Tax=Micromonospora rosaria TaxID=47874 RepID=A0A136PIF8_9ACTN|nr:NBR1-Ig-like domain-containing protein [Micromonospora rosaria]KXK58183.1 hypothetical protein AWW66_31240 [Micromonospora rosaria]
MREVGGALRQIRVAAGYEQLESAASAVNAAVRDLYPDVAAGPPARATVSRPHQVDGRYLSNVELGNANKLSPPDWLRTGESFEDEQLRSGQIPSWLVRAYDVAFLADGYLVDLYRWGVALQADQAGTPPRAARTRQFARVGVSGYDTDVRAFDAAPQAIRNLLGIHRGLLSTYPTAAPALDAWVPAHEDRSTLIADPTRDIPEGLPVRPGSYVVGHWILRNSGKVRWQDRLFVRVGQCRVGLTTPPFTPVPTAEPGQNVTISVPVRAPDRPGTYRSCFRLAWPDGTYCYPNTLVGAIVTLVVLPEEYLTCDQPWASR